MINNKYLVISTSASILCCILLLYSYLEITGSSDVIIATIVSSLPLFFMFFLAKNRSIISPIGFYIMSVSIFILSRPFINLFVGIDIVEAGILGGEYEIAKTIYLIGIGVAITCLFISLPMKYERYDYILFKPVLVLPNWIRTWLLYISVLLILVFL